MEDYANISSAAFLLDIEQKTAELNLEYDEKYRDELIAQIAELNESNAKLEKSCEKLSKKIKVLKNNKAMNEKTTRALKQSYQAMSEQYYHTDQQMKMKNERFSEMEALYKKKLVEVEEAFQTNPDCLASVCLDNEIELVELETKICHRDLKYIKEARRERDRINWMLERHSIIQLAELVVESKRQEEDREREIARLKREKNKEELAKLKRTPSLQEVVPLKVIVAPDVARISPPELTPLFELLPTEDYSQCSLSRNTSLNQSLEDSSEPPAKIPPRTTPRTDHIPKHKTPISSVDRFVDTSKHVTFQKTQYIPVYEKKIEILNEVILKKSEVAATAQDVGLKELKTVDVVGKQSAGLLKMYMENEADYSQCSLSRNTSLNQSLEDSSEPPAKIPPRTTPRTDHIPKHKNPASSVDRFVDTSKHVTFQKTQYIPVYEKKVTNLEMNNEKKIEILNEVILKKCEVAATAQDVGLKELKTVDVVGKQSAGLLKMYTENEAARTTLEPSAPALVPPTQFQDPPPQPAPVDVPMEDAEPAMTQSMSMQESQTSFRLEDSLLSVSFVDGHDTDKQVNFTQLRNDIMSKYKVSSSPEFVYKKTFDKPTVSKFFPTLPQAAEQAPAPNATDQAEPMKPIQEEPEQQPTEPQVRDNTKESKGEQVTQDADAFDSKMTASSDLDETNYDFSGMIDTPSLLLSPKPDEPFVATPNQAGVTSLFGAPRPAFSLKSASGGADNAGASGTQENSQDGAFNFSFQQDKKKKGFFSLF